MRNETPGGVGAKHPDEYPLNQLNKEKLVNFYIKSLLAVSTFMRKTLGWIPGMKAYIGFFERSYVKHQKAWTIYGILTVVGSVFHYAYLYNLCKRGSNIKPITNVEWTAENDEQFFNYNS